MLMWVAVATGYLYVVGVTIFKCVFFFFSSRRRHTRYWRDWSSDVCSSDLPVRRPPAPWGRARPASGRGRGHLHRSPGGARITKDISEAPVELWGARVRGTRDRKSVV